MPKIVAVGVEDLMEHIVRLVQTLWRRFVVGVHVACYLAAVKEQVKRDWVDEKQREIQNDYVNSVIAAYVVEIEEGAWDGDWTLTPEP